MKKLSLYIIIFSIIASKPLLLPTETYAKDSGFIAVKEAYVCRGVINRKTLGIGDTFTASVEKLYCFTRIISVQHPIEITHVWYFGNVKRAEVKLMVRSSNWRKYSSKIIQQNEVGDWHIDVLGPKGNVLKTLQFKITH